MAGADADAGVLGEVGCQLPDGGRASGPKSEFGPF